MTNKPKIKFLLSFVLSVIITAVLVLLYVVLKLEIEKLTKEKIVLEETISAEKNIATMLLVEVQKLESRERIVGIAKDKLGMLTNNEAKTVIEMEKFQVDHTIKAVNSKYE